MDTLWAEIEAEQEWRTEEIRFFANRMNASDVPQATRYIRPLVLLLYSHFEGFLKFAFLLYVRAVNEECLTCGEANFALEAASLSKVFASLRDPQRKSDLFRRALPDDSVLHRFARDREFVERLEEMRQQRVLVPDAVIDTESNLKPEVLSKCLYRLGLRHDIFEAKRDAVNRLLNQRNRISHGETRQSIDRPDYDSLEKDVFEIMDTTKNLVMEALRKKAYLRSSPRIPA